MIVPQRLVSVIIVEFDVSQDVLSIVEDAKKSLGDSGLFLDPDLVVVRDQQELATELLKLGE